MAAPRKLSKYGRLHPGDVNVPHRKLVLFAADTPNSWKPAAVLEELKLSYDVIWVDIMGGEQNTTEYLKLNPNGRTPTLVDLNLSPPHTVFESGAIMLYLCENYGKGSSLLPAPQEERSQVVQWLFWQVSALGPMVGQCMYFKRIAGSNVQDLATIEFGITRFENESMRLLRILDRRLEGRDYLCGRGQRGSYTIADIACWGYAQSHWWAGLDISKFANLQAWITRVGDKPAVKAGQSIPGVSVLGKKGPTFAKLATDVELQERLEKSAADAGRKYFGWKELNAEVNAGDGAPIAFASHVPSTKTTAVATTWSQGKLMLVGGVAAAALLTSAFVAGRLSKR